MVRSKLCALTCTTRRRPIPDRGPSRLDGRVKPRRELRCRRSLIYKLPVLRWSGATARYSRLYVPVETSTPPCRRSKLHIIRFAVNGKAHSFRCSSSSSRTRFAGLRLDWRTERKSERRTNSTRLTTKGKARSFRCSSAPDEPACAGLWPDGETIPSFFHGKREKDKTTTIVLLGFSSAGKRREYFIRRGG